VQGYAAKTVFEVSNIRKFGKFLSLFRRRDLAAISATLDCFLWKCDLGQAGLLDTSSRLPSDLGVTKCIILRDMILNLVAFSCAA
jgi:hypothetical protein